MDQKTRNYQRSQSTLTLKNIITTMQKSTAAQNRKIKYKQKKILVPLFFLLIVTIAGVWYITRPRPSLAPAFSLTDLDGMPFSLSDFRGKIVIIDFMATWCGSCRLQIPYYEVIWEEYQDRIVILSIDIDVRESEEILRDFAQDYPYATWIWARDTVNLSEAYKITLIPTTVIIDQEGSISFIHVGVTSSTTLNQEIQELMDK
jgi:thiol-disulfide isomerase/thioredoxin